MSFLKNPKLWANVALVASITCILAVIASIAGVRMDAMGFRTATSILRTVVQAGLIVFVLAALTMLLSRTNRTARNRSALAAALVVIPLAGIISVQPAGTPLFAGAPPGPPVTGMAGTPSQGMAVGMGVGMGGGAAGRTPPLNDISTDTQDPPLYNAVIPHRPQGSNTVEYPGAIAAQTQKQLFPDIAPIESELSMDDAIQRALRVAEDMGWEIIAQGLTDGVIEAVATTRFFDFQDDVVIRVRANGTGSIVDIRSHSRIGRGDQGKNAGRVRDFIAAF